MRGRRVYLCARCTGIGLGLLLGLLYVNLLSNIFLDYPVLIALFTIPAIIDWLLQVFGFQESNNLRRVLTGSLVGQTYLVGLVALFRGWSPLLSDYALVYAGYAVGLYFLFRTTGVMKDYMSKSWPIS